MHLLALRNRNRMEENENKIKKLEIGKEQESRQQTVWPGDVKVCVRGPRTPMANFIRLYGGGSLPWLRRQRLMG